MGKATIHVKKSVERDRIRVKLEPLPEQILDRQVPLKRVAEVTAQHDPRYPLVILHVERLTQPVARFKGGNHIFLDQVAGGR